MANSAVSVEASKFRLANNGAKATAVEKKQIHNEVSIAKDQVLKQSFTKKLSKDRKAVTQQVRRMASATRAAQSTTDADTVHIQAAYFSIEQYPGEWYIGVMNQEETYQVYFDYFSETMTGSFTTEDFYMTYSKVYDFTGDGVAVNFNAVELTITETTVSSTLTRVNLDAVIDGSDGKVYVVTGFYETITPKKTVELVVTENTVLQDGEGSFAIEGQTTYEGELVTVSALIASEDVLGEFSASDFYSVGSFVGFGPVDEMNIILQRKEANPLSAVEAVTSPEIIKAMSEEVKQVKVSGEICKYIVQLVSATRQSKSISLGASPRATLALMKLAQAYAYLDGRDYVIAEDIGALFTYVISHRIVLSQEARLNRKTAAEAVSEVFRSVEVPYRTGR